MYEYSCVIKRVIDGDTIEVDIDLGFDVWLHNQRVRLAGIDAPAIRTTDLEEKEMGFETMRFVEKMLPVGEERTLQSRSDMRGKYGRIIGSFLVYDGNDDRWTDLCELLLEQGLAEVFV
jgi:micrococcal nuclease